MKIVMVISCLILIFSTVTQITQEMGIHSFDSIRSTHGLLIFSITSFILKILMFQFLRRKQFFAMH